MNALKYRLRRTRAKICTSCGSRLAAIPRARFDPFWIVVLIVVGAVFAFYLLGILAMGIGLSLLRQRKQEWACLKCQPEAEHLPA